MPTLHPGEFLLPSD